MILSMEPARTEYTVSQLAEIAGVSVRTLHHYDQIGLLSPAGRTAGGYRIYRRADVLRLQQILLYRELDLPLNEIRAILDQPGYDPLETLRQHREALQQRRGRLDQIIETVERTIRSMTEDEMTLSDEELYAGLTPEQAERYPREARQRWGEARVSEAEGRVRKLSKAEWARIGKQGEDATRAMAALIGRAPDDPQVQEAVELHHAWIENFYPAPAEVYRGLGQMYLDHPEFRAYYEERAEGLAEFMRASIEGHCQQKLS